jgi:hypothetical protein
MRIQVDHHPDDRGTSAPSCLHFGRRQVGLRETVDQWYGPDYRYLKVRSHDGDLYILRVDEPHDAWSLIMYQRA